MLLPWEVLLLVAVSSDRFDVTQIRSWHLPRSERGMICDFGALEGFVVSTVIVHVLFVHGRDEAIMDLWHHCHSWFHDSSVAWAIGVHVETLALDGLDIQQHVE